MLRACEKRKLWKKLQKVFALLMAISMTMSLLSVTALANEKHPHKFVPCETCGGDGLTDTPCGSCDGKGAASVTTDEGTGEISESDCTACGGTGYGACNGTFEAGKTTEPTCTEPGSTVYTCATYGASYEEEIPAKGHTVENWETTKEPTCMACGAQEAVLEDTGVTIVRQGAEGLTYDIGEGQVIMLASPDDTNPIVFGNCTFNLTGKTVKISGNQNGISYNNGETITKLWIGSNVQFANCTFLTGETGSKSSSAGYDACIYFFSGNIVLNGCTLSATGYDAIFVEDSTITVNNNLGNACNSGYWIVNDSTITMNGNRGGHALSCIGFEMSDSTVEIMHNGYAGIYLQSGDSSFTRWILAATVKNCSAILPATRGSMATH